ncbi:MAG: histidinol-phosphate transaminase, partial [Bacteroidota bacterium]
PLQDQLKKRIAELKGVQAEQIFLGNGSDEIIDLLLRLFTQPGRDSIVTLPPTYGMYQVSAQIQRVGVKEVPLNSDLQPNLGLLLAETKETDKILFLCTPNNPTGNLLDEETVEILLQAFPGILVIDEAYIDFSSRPSWIEKLAQYPRLVVLQTLSKAWGLAGLRIGMAFADPDLVDWLGRIKPPYNISSINQELALEQLKRPEEKDQWVEQIKASRKALRQGLMTIGDVQEIYPSEANFLLVRLERPEELYQYLVEQGIIVRNRSQLIRCQGGLRLTIGTNKENNRLLEAIYSFYQTSNVPLR